MKRLLKLLKIIFYALIFIIITALIVRLLLYKGTVQPVMALPETPIIDMHVHIAGYGNGGSGCFISDNMRQSYKFDYYLQAFGVTRDEVETQGDQLVVKKLSGILAKSKHVQAAVVLALDGVINDKGELDRSKTQVYIPNDYVAEQVNLYDNLYFGASINPYRHDALARLEKVKQQGAKLIKWIPNIQYIDPGDKKLIPFYRKLRELELPLLSHAGQEHSFVSAIDSYGDPRRLALPLSLGVTVIAAHIATTGHTNNILNYERILPLFEQYPNLYTDMSTLTQINKLGYLDKALLEPRLKGRVLYGSDYPLSNMVLVSPYYFPFNLTRKEMQRIARIRNHWDRDIALKQALGVPDEIFASSAKLLRIE